MTIIVLVACGKQKLDHPAPAGLLYTGTLFRLAREAAIASRHTWAILSAKHGLVLPETVTAPYDETLPRGRSGRRADWAQLVRRQLQTMYGRPGHVRFLAPDRYVHPLADELQGRGWSYDAPLARLGIGEQQAALKRLYRTDDA